MILSGALLTYILDGLLDLLVGNPTSLCAFGLASTKLHQHVTATKQLLGTLLVQNNA